jgi:hypothetical protein
MAYMSSREWPYSNDKAELEENLASCTCERKRDRDDQHQQINQQAAVKEIAMQTGIHTARVTVRPVPRETVENQDARIRNKL